jgi:GAF domain-containing protein
VLDPRIDPAGRNDPVEEALAELERAQRHRWLVATLLVLAIVAALGLVVLDEELGGPVAPWAAVAFLAVAVVFGLSVISRERRTRRAIRALLRERERATVLVARTRSMEAVHTAVREVVAASDLVDVFARVVGTVRELAHANTAVVLLRRGDELTVAAAEGADPPPLGAVVPRGPGPTWSAIDRGEPVLAGDDHQWGPGRAGAMLVVPLVLPDRVVGVLLVERMQRPFTALDELTLELFAQHVALAVRNATLTDARVQAAEEAVAAAGGRRQAIAAQADELRSPLASIAGYTELLLRRGDRFTAQRRGGVLRDIQAELERCRELVDRLVRTTETDAPADETPTEAATGGSPADGAPTGEASVGEASEEEPAGDAAATADLPAVDVPGRAADAPTGASDADR